MPMRVFTDSRCLEHVVPYGFPEVPARLEGILAGLEAAGLPIEGPGPHPRTDTVIAAVHDPVYVERLEDAIETGQAFIDTGDNPLSPGSWQAARAAVDACLWATDWVMEAPARRAFAAVRPPGHHAERSMAMGFCYLNNIAIAAEYLRLSDKAQRVAIFDFDVHHGNGTQHLFEDRSDVFYASVHQHPFYPGTGTLEERGRDAGLGATMNVPLPAGSGDQEYAQVFEKIILPSLRRFRPEVLLLSIGFDAWRADPVGGMRVSREAFRDWGRWLGGIADELCSGRIVAALEGGYDLNALAELAVAHCQGLAESAD